MKNNLKVERARKDITQGELADIIDVSRQTINAVEKNRYVPSTVLALKLSEYFGKSVNELFELEKTINPKKIVITLPNNAFPADSQSFVS